MVHEFASPAATKSKPSLHLRLLLLCPIFPTFAARIFSIKRLAELRNLKFKIFILAFAAALSAQAQTLRGLVVDEAGRPVASASIYVRELQLGTAAGEQGAFELRLRPGTYTLTVQCVGYISATQAVTVEPQGANVRVQLATKAYELPAVIVSKSKEDFAYTVMRHAIAMAPYYSNEVSSYRAEVYLKGSGKVKKISLAVRALARKEIKQANIREGETYIIESMNEIAFTAPNSYRHKVLSSKNTLPPGVGDRLNTMNFVNVNVYSMNMFAKDAMANYTFAYEGFVEDGELLIYKIRIVPRKKTAGLMRGYVYIVDGTWRAYSLDVAGDFPFGTFSGKLSTNELSGGVWLPTSYNIGVTLKALGNEVVMSYAGTVRYENIVKNSTLQNPLAPRTASPAATVAGRDTKPKPSENVAAAKPKSQRDSIRQAKRRKDLEDLLAKDELTNREMRKVTSLMQQEVETDKPVSLNITTDYKVEVDSSARQRDSTFWNAVRPIPLRGEELTQMRRSDSIKAIAAQPQAKAVRPMWQRVVGTALLGKTYNTDGWRVHYSGLLSTDLLGFNAVDGFRYGQKLQLRHQLADSTTLFADARAAWAFSRKALMWHAGLSYHYLPERRADAFINAGSWSSDFNSSNHTSYATDAITLLTHTSHQALYSNLYVNLGNNIDLTNGLALQVYGSFNIRRRLSNSTDFALFFPHKSYAPNRPFNPYIDNNFELHRASIINASLTYTPQQFYRMRGRQKRMAHSRYPTFTLGWREGIPRLLGSEADFSMARIAVSQRSTMGLFETFSYSVEGVKFFRNRQLDFPDYHHYRTPGYVAFANGGGDWWSYYYRNSTPSWGATAELAYVTPYLALKYIPGFDQTICRENIHARIIYTPRQQAFTELGYAVSEIFFMLKLGVFVGFENEKFRTVRVGVELDL